ncbi:MAG TPA: sigma-70 family RNA polymerase sigma factor [Bryobacteraceae bacterium]|jgi:RNA polymerase sigma-70 factor (ECF subfamily)
MSQTDSGAAADQPGVLIEHLFRRHAGKMVSHLTRLLGPAHLSIAEEAVQDSMLRAISSWPYDGIPRNPEGWLFRVAHNSAIDALRHRRMAGSKSAELTAELRRAASHPVLEQTFRDDELSLIFMCCHPAIPPDSRIALSLKTACGFSVREVARALLAAEDAIAQRIVRAKKQIRDQRLSIEMPSGHDLEERIDSVLAVIYSMFNEGYSAHEGEDLIRLELCREALRLGLLIASSEWGRPKVHALVALMALQTARIRARVDEAGDLVLLDDQDPTQWDHQLIALGFHHFDRAIGGADVSRYHIESAIAVHHAQPATDWRAILELYDQLLELDPGSAVVRLNRAVAVARVDGATAALAAIEPLSRDRSLAGYHLREAVRAHFLMETGEKEEAASAFRAALACRCSMPERRFLERKLQQCLSG